MSQRPTGTVTFLFTDIEGSTRLWEEHPVAMEAALADHDALLRHAIESRGGYVFNTAGDSFHAAFRSAADALEAAAAAQLSLGAEPWPEIGQLCVRLAVHTGEADERGGDYFGPTLNRAARLRAVAHGGQTVISHTAAEAARTALPPDTSLRDLGQHRLRDLSRSEHVFQLTHPGLRADFPPLNVLDKYPNNLPVQLTSIIGRKREIDRIKVLLPASRLLTLTGVGGCGKTRLALQIAADVLDDYPDGARLVEMAPLADPALVTQAVASSLNLREEPGRPLVDTLISYLEDRTLLLLLDNCEHLIEPLARLADTLLHRCHKLRILATSREGLGITGELTFPVPSLALPDTVPETVTEEILHTLSRTESVSLFIDRALLTKPSFQLTAQNAQAVVDICHRLDGIPLALELAAARVRLLPVEQIRRHLDDRFRLLTGGSRTALPRQQTLRATIDWGHDLLGETERLLFRRLAVFRGGWTLGAAESVCVGGGIEERDVLDLLGRLLDKSLAVVDEMDGTGRYRMLQTISQYAAEKLAGSGENGATRDRHLDHFLALAEEAARELTGADQAAWLDRLEAEHDNLRAALDWGSEQTDPERGLRLSSALWRFWYMHGYWSEGQRRLAGLMAHPGVRSGTAPQAEALNRWANLLSAQGDLEGARALYEESLAVKRQLGDVQGTAACLNNLGIVAAQQGEYDAARELYAESLALHRGLGNQLGISNLLNNLAGVAADQGDHDAARRLYEESLELCRKLGNPQAVANSLNNLGEMARAEEDLAAAQELYVESLAISREIGDQRLVAMTLGNLGAIARKQGDHEAARALHDESLNIHRQLGYRLGIADSFESYARLAAVRALPRRAARLIGAAEALREAIGTPLPPADRARLDEAMAASHEALGEAAFDAAVAEGRGMTMDEAIEYALAGEPSGGEARQRC